MKTHPTFIHDSPFFTRAESWRLRGRLCDFHLSRWLNVFSLRHQHSDHSARGPCAYGNSLFYLVWFLLSEVGAGNSISSFGMVVRCRKGCGCNGSDFRTCHVIHTHSKCFLLGVFCSSPTFLLIITSQFSSLQLPRLSIADNNDHVANATKVVFPMFR
jgi:hypothetical protein